MISCWLIHTDHLRHWNDYKGMKQQQQKICLLEKDTGDFYLASGFVDFQW